MKTNINFLSSSSDSKLRDLRNKLREELNEDLSTFGGDTNVPNPNKPPSKSARPTETTDYFELVFECVHKRMNFLNIISLNARNPVEPDIDLAILQALLNGKKKFFSNYEK